MVVTVHSINILWRGTDGNLSHKQLFWEKCDSDAGNKCRKCRVSKINFDVKSQSNLDDPKPSPNLKVNTNWVILILKFKYGVDRV